MKGKKKIFQQRRKSSPANFYFHEGTQAAIVKYQTESSDVERSRLYVDEILPAFERLVENLIRIHNAEKNTDEPYENLKNDCITFLFETIRKYDSTRGTKAFSYFNVVARNWIIIRVKQRTKSKGKQVYLDDKNLLGSYHRQVVENYDVVPSQEDTMIDEERISEIFSLLSKIKRRITNPNEMVCIEAIMDVFDRIDDLEFINKRAMYVYIRELSNLNSKQLSAAMSQIKRYYKDVTDSEEFHIF